MVERLRPPEHGRIDLFDAQLPGLGLRVSSTGAKAWFVFYRFGGRQRRHTIGTTAAYPKLDAAREQAGEIMRAVDRDEDPAASPEPERANTVGSAVAEFIVR